MASVMIDLRSAEDMRDVVHRAVQALAEGKIVAVPTETVYGLAVSALNPRAVDDLFELKQRPQGHPFVLAVKSAEDALDYLPRLPGTGQRLARRCWPGPVTLVADGGHPESLLQQLPDDVRQKVTLNNQVALRVPAHPIPLDVMRMLAGPLALTSANLHGQPDATTAEQIVQTFGDKIPLVLNDGPSRLGQPSTIVRVDDQGITVLRQGVVSAQTLRRLSSFMIVLVCTGNTCRSPMAEALCRKLIAERMGCKLEELADKGVVVLSAGVSAAMGHRASEEAVQVMSEAGLSLADHESQQLTEQLVRQADLIWTMTRSHRNAIVQHWPEAAARTMLLQEGGDVVDPIGGPLEFYQHCANQIKEALIDRIKKLEW